MWLGCTSAEASPTCCTAPEGTQAGGTLRMSDSDSMCYCGNHAIDDGAWHHVAMVKKGHTRSEIRLYVDGVLDSVTANSWAGLAKPEQLKGAGATDALVKLAAARVNVRLGELAPRGRPRPRWPR